jgi:hypothetical protein
MSDRWRFGVEPLAQTTRAAALLRRVAGLVTAVEQDDEVVERLIADLARAEDSLVRVVPPDPAPRVGPAADGDGRIYLDHAFAIGRYNACFPEYDIVVVDAARAHGSVAFPVAYEGPPGLVHGGFLAVFFDCVVQQHNCEVGVAGKTTSLALRYRRPAPLLTTLRFTLERSVADERIRTSAALSDGERVVCEADVDAIAGVRANLPAVSERRTVRG